MKRLNDKAAYMYARMQSSLCDVTVNSRFVAYLIDWFVGTIFIFIIPIYMYSILTGSTNMQEAMVFLNYPGNNGFIACGIAFLMALIYYVLIPWKVWKGQTLGKRAFGFKIVRNNGEDVTLWTLIKRQLVGIALIEGNLIVLTSLYRQGVFLFSGYDAPQLLIYAWVGISVISCMLVVFVGNGKMIHDYIGGTYVMMDPNRKINNRKDARI